ncbi:MAG: restriction endonuclease [Terriglobales bacterium]|jgi:restriction endonuclease
MPNAHSEFSEARVENLLAEVFRRAGWRVEEEPRFGHYEADLLVRKDDLVYVVEIKRASEGRPDRLIPLISQAILQAQVAARKYGLQVSPLAVVCAPRISESAAAQIREFAAANAPDVSVGVFDVEGYRSFVGPGLEVLNQKRQSLSRNMMMHREQPKIDLFSGINQWLLKVMLAPRIPESLLAAPRQEYRNASQLAQASGVSIMSAFRFVKQLQEEGFLHESEESLQLVRVEHLMQRWQAANPSLRELRMRWLIRSDAPDALNAAVRQLLLNPNLPRARHFIKAGPNSVKRSGSPIRVCAALFSAAELLGLNFVHGAPRHLYVEEPNPELFQLLGLVSAREGESVDVFVRVPAARASIFRAAVDVGGVPASDVLQVWLDVGAHPARGRDQADEIWRRILAPSLGVK